MLAVFRLLTLFFVFSFSICQLKALSKQIDVIDILPPPPAVDSKIKLNDQEIYLSTRKMKDTKPWQQAKQDAAIEAEDLAKIFSPFFDKKINKKTYPNLYKIIEIVREDTHNEVKKIKNYYKIIRPFVFYNHKICDEKSYEHLKQSYSYPSGHATTGWTLGLLLAEVNPKESNKIIYRAFEYGQSRVICGAHWQSDVDAGRLLASIIVSKLHSNDDFIELIQKAKKELGKDSDN